MLRMLATRTSHRFDGDDAASVSRVNITGSLQLEVVATFRWTAASLAANGGAFGVSVLGGAANLSVVCPPSGLGCLGTVNGATPQYHTHGTVSLHNAGAPRHLARGPLMPLKQMSTTLHAIVDHTITEVIYNNRTAMVVYVEPPSANATAASLFGVGSCIQGTIETLALKEASNLGPQPLKTDDDWTDHGNLAGDLVVEVDPLKLGHRFAGVGAQSIAGTSSLLRDYSEGPRKKILDLLFLKQHGAALQHLKVEIGGDAQISCGAEASHWRSGEEPNFERGYEWWLMKESKHGIQTSSSWAWCTACRRGWALHSRAPPIMQGWRGTPVRG